jgi:hypothetical protein
LDIDSEFFTQLFHSMSWLVDKIARSAFDLFTSRLGDTMCAGWHVQKPS